MFFLEKYHNKSSADVYHFARQMDVRCLPSRVLMSFNEMRIVEGERALQYIGASK